VLVQPEMERGRSLLVSNSPFGAGSLQPHMSIGLNSWIAHDTSAVGNGKQRKARTAVGEPHDYCGRPVSFRMALWRGSGL
jgi:hypothetical protein